MDSFLKYLLVMASSFLGWRIVRRFLVVRLRMADAVLVTGCDTGFGRAIALHLSRMSCGVVFAGCISMTSMDELRGNGGNIRPLLLDVTNEEQVREAVEAVTKSGLKLRGIINNAGISAFGWSEQLPLKRYKANMEVNYFGVVRMCQAFLPLLRASKGRIVNMGSIGGRMPSAFGSAYLSTKAAMMSYSECLRQEVFRFGVRVILVEPGFFATSLLAEGGENGRTDSKLCSDEVIRAYPKYASKIEATKRPIQLLEQLNGGAHGVHRVVRCVEDALVSRFPLARYVVGVDAHALRLVGVNLPAWLVDWAQTVA